MARLQYSVSLDQFLDGIISLFITLQFSTAANHFFLSLLPLAAAFLAGAFLASGLARGFAAAFFATGFFAGAFFFATFGASSSPSSPGPATTGFSRFGRGPMVGLLSLVRISVMRSTVISSR